MWTEFHQTVGSWPEYVTLVIIFAYSDRDLLARHSRIAHQNIDSATIPPEEGIQRHSSQLEVYDYIGPSSILAVDPNPVQNSQGADMRISSGLRQASATSIFDTETTNFGTPPPSQVEFFPHDLTSDLEFLWNYGSTPRDFLPTNVLDTDFPLSQLWPSTTPFEAMGEEEPVYISPQQPGNLQSHVAQNMPTAQCTESRPLTVLEAAIHKPNEERLPPNDLNNDTDSDEGRSWPYSWKVPISVHDTLTNVLSKHRTTLPPGFAIPSRHTLSRFVEGYFQGFHMHLPFLHAPTFSIETLPSELLLALTAAGACYRFEYSKVYELYFAAKALVTEKMRVQVPSSAAYLTAQIPHVSLSPQQKAVQSTPSPGSRTRTDLEMIQSLIILMNISSWTDLSLIRDSISMSSQLGMLIREAGISTPDEIAEGTEWLQWVSLEVRRRTLFAAYLTINLQSIAFDVPPTIFNQEIALCLPHCGSEWAATSAPEFMELRRMYGHNEVKYVDVFQNLLDGHDISPAGPYSAFGNYVLMSGLLQRIFLERHTSGHLSDPIRALRPSVIKSLERSLQAWQKSWESTQESTLDPSSSKGPLGLNAVAMLRLAYIRLNANLGAHRNLASQDPRSLALALTNDSLTLFARSLHLDRAILQCIHALSVPIHHGIVYMAYAQSTDWSIQVALSNLEAAFLLSRWLYVLAKAVENTGIQSLRDDEKKLIGMTMNLIKETSLGSSLYKSQDPAQRLRVMGATVVRLWSQTFEGSHVFKLIDTIGVSLNIAAEILEKEN